MKMIKGILIICIALLVLLLIFCIWFVRVPAGVRIFPDLAKTPLNKFIEYKELIEVLKEKGIETNRTQFFCDNLNVNLDT